MRMEQGSDVQLSSPGRSGGIPPPLRLEEIEQCRKAVDVGGEEAKKTLAKLVDHLDDQLVTVRRVRLREEGSCRLAIFREPDGERLFYVSVSGYGSVGVGRADLSSEPSTGQRLADFNHLRDEVVAIVVTRRFRLIGDRLDVFIFVRSVRRGERGSSEERRVYHGLITIAENGQPHLEPADDWGDRRTREWEAHSVLRFPHVLSRWRLSLGVDIDPFTADRSKLTKSLIEREAQERIGDLEAVAWTESYIVCAADGSLSLCCQDRGEWSDAPLPLAEEIEFLSLTPGPESSVRGMTGSDTRRLIAFSGHSEEGLEECWDQILWDFPVDVAFLPAKASQDCWPDLLVSYRDGILERLHHVGKDAVRQLWNDLWRSLGWESAAERLSAAGREMRRVHNDRWCRTVLFGSIEKVLEEAAGVSAAERSRWLDQVAELFAPELDHRLLVAGLGPLLDSVVRPAGARSGSAPPDADVLDKRR